MKSEIYFEYSGKKVLADELEKKVKEIWKTSGKVIKDMKELKIYFNVAEEKCYYIINDEIKGDFSI